MMSVGLLSLPQLPSHFLSSSPILGAFTPSHHAPGRERCSLQVASWEGIGSTGGQLRDPVHRNFLASLHPGRQSELRVSGARVLICTCVLQGTLASAFRFCSATGRLERKLGGGDIYRLFFFSSFWRVQRKAN